MIQQQFDFQIVLNNDNYNFQQQEYQIQFNNIDFQQCDKISVQQIIYPKSYYLVKEQFNIYVEYEYDGVQSLNIYFNPGNYSFIQLIQNLQYSLPEQLFLVQELNQDQCQTGKIHILNILQVPISITIPDQYSKMFGHLQCDIESLDYYSQTPCDLTNNQMLFLKSNCVQQLYIDNNSQSDNLLVFSVDQTVNFSYYIQSFDVQQNMKGFKKHNYISFKFLNDQGQQILQNQNIYLQFKIFHYRIGYIDKQLKLQDKIIKLLNLIFNYGDKKGFDKYMIEQQNDQ